MRYRWLMLLLLCLGLNSPIQAQTSLTLIDIHNTPPEQLLPLLEPLLLPGESARTFRNQLVVDASPGSLQRIRALLQEVDRPLRNLLIEVDDGLNTQTSEQGLETAGRIRVENGSTRGRADIHIRDQHSRQDSRLSQQLRAVEGYPAFVAMTQQQPVAVQGRYGERLVTQTHTQGFFVTARLQGSRVFLDISTSHGHPDDARQQHRQTGTTVSGNLGDWITIAGLEQQSETSDSGLLSNSQQTLQQSGSVRLRVRLAD